ncbi:RNaseH domain-containing protein [Actinokineospora enzanensis]|uniref:RNaseH domain-containing protein n=1 Tax=Actinokineospora enzanensis TaxID=155975 RepID=UPI00037284E6|nr:RNaseH domain-containing protein [Actinokineospora enzanensis]
MTTGVKELRLLAYPLTDVLHGVVWVHRFPDRVGEVWDGLVDRYRDLVHHRVNLPYSGLATALRAYGNACVNLFPTSRDRPPRQMVSSRPLDPRDVRDAVALWEQAVLGVPDDEITFGYPSELADLVAGSPAEPVSLADQVRHSGSQPDAPNWVYDAATWEAARLLAARPWQVDGREVTLRADTDGNLVAWDERTLWSGSWRAEAERSYATLRVRLMMKTVPGMRTPVLVLDPAVSRLSRWLNGSSNAWLAPRDNGDPLLCLAVEGRGRVGRIERTSGIALTVAHRLRGEHLLGPEDHDLTGVPGRLRALVAKSVRFPVGRGVGMYTLRELSRHAREVLGVPNVSAREVAGHRFSLQSRRKTEAGRDADLLDRDGLPAIITATGAERLRVLLLYTTQQTRGRVQRLLAHHFDQASLADGIPEDIAVPVGERVEIVVHHAAALLAHGDHRERAAHRDRIPHLVAPPGTRVLALCETEYDGNSPEGDGKHIVRRLLAERGVLAQFLRTAPPTKQVDNAPADGDADECITVNVVSADHAGHNAIADLLRAAGLVHPRLTSALAYGRLGTKEPLAFVGLHVREQRGQAWAKGRPKLSWSLVAMVPEGAHWRTLAYQFSPHPVTGGGTGWRDYFTANAAFRALPLPDGKRDDETLVVAIDIALGQLQPHLVDDAGYVLMVSGDSSRSLWPLLANKNLDLAPDSTGRIGDRPALPGWNPGLRNRPRAVVRITSGTPDLPRPVEVHDLGAPPDHERRVIKQTRSLYQLDDAVNTWVLANVPRQFDGGFPRRAGAEHGRWSASPGLNRSTWYVHTNTEIVVVGADGDPLRYAVAAARLCDHAVSWDGRTRYPAPVHLAALMDRDHPEYRRTVDGETGVDEITGALPDG